jgi:hypothetical protein
LVSRYDTKIHSQKDRDRTKRYIDAAPIGTCVTIKATKRTLAQNSKMWPMLTEVAEQTTHHGVRLRPDDWKLLFLDAMKRELKMVPNLDGDGFVPLNRSSSDLTKDEMSNLIELIYAWGAQQSPPVEFKDV